MVSEFTAKMLKEVREIVLILVLVEDGLRGSCRTFCYTSWSKGLNPCSCGGWSQRFRIDMKNNVKIVVLILVLVEDGLRGVERRTLNIPRRCVLILVLVEDGLREFLV